MFDVDTWVSQEFQRLAQVINDYDHNLFLEMIPREFHEQLNDKTKVFRIVDDRTKSVVYTFDSLSNPTDILAKLFNSDNTKGDPIQSMDARNAAIEALNNEKVIEEREAKKDFVAFVIKNTKSRWEHQGQVFDDEFRRLGPKRTVID